MSKRAPPSTSSSTAIENTPVRLETETYEWEPDEVDGFYKLVHRMEEAVTIDDWSWILADYVARGNSKIANEVRIFNMNSGTDCPNAHSENCQVGDACYAIKSETMYKQTLPYRRRQEYLWDSLDPDTWAHAFMKIVDRANEPVTALRFNQSGDMRHETDIYKAERVAELLSVHGIAVYTYSASDYLDFSTTDHLTVNMSNARRPGYGDKHFSAVPPGMEATDLDHLDETAVQCPYDKSGGADQFKCGNCTLCFESNGPDVYINIH